MSYVHLHFASDLGDIFPAVDAIVVETLGRSSVPLLSVISGFLMVGFFRKRGYFEAVLQRGRSLLLPMIIWNAIAVLLLGQNGALWNDIFALSHTSRLIYLTFCAICLWFPSSCRSCPELQQSHRIFCLRWP